MGGLLTAWVGWRGIFLFTAPLAAGAAVLVAAYLRGEWAEAKGERFDLVGTLLYVGALVALMVGLAGASSLLGVTLVMAGVLGLGVFLAWETSASSPLLDLRLFRENPVFVYSNLPRSSTTAPRSACRFCSASTSNSFAAWPSRRPA